VKILFPLFLFILPASLFSQGYKKTVRELQKGKLQEDTSYIYWLPYKENTSQLMVQGYLTKYSHQNLVANDFKMKMGTTICASRGGVVKDMEEDSNIGGLKDKENHWNYVIIQHEDSSSAIYGHLKQNGALVKVGDTVEKGQEIGLSGNTGYSAFPHLHFQVYDKNGEQIPVRFLTQYGNQYLRQVKIYTCTHISTDRKK
jgi:murein DD-endopeptidase MepM/ murein hydrolase activator NlpD